MSYFERHQREHGGVEGTPDWELGAQVVVLVLLAPSLYKLGSSLYFSELQFFYL